MAVLATTSKSRRDRSDYTNRFHILRKEQVIKCIAEADPNSKSCRKHMQFKTLVTTGFFFRVVTTGFDT